MHKLADGVRSRATVGFVRKLQGKEGLSRADGGLGGGIGGDGRMTEATLTATQGIEKPMRKKHLSCWWSIER